MTDVAKTKQPATPNYVIAPRDDEIGINTDPTKEYVAAGPQVWYGDYKRALEHPIDDVTRDFGNDTYQRMHNDPQINSCTNTLKTAILSGGLRLNVVELPDNAPEADKVLAQTLADFCIKIINDLETPIQDVLWNMLDALYLGNKVAETVWIVGYGWEDGPKLELKRINVKPQSSVAFVVDAFNNILGVLGQLPDVGLPVLQGTFLADDNVANLLPREKFLIFTFRPIDNDPRGSSLYRPLYNIWWIAQQLYPEWLKYLAQFAVATLIGYTPENAQPKIEEDDNGNPVLDENGKPKVIYPERAMANTLVQVRNGSVVAFRGGSKVDALKAGENGDQAFANAFTIIDNWKSKVILHQTLATQEGQHQARASSEVHKDIFDLLVQSIKESLLLAFRRDVLKMLARVNYGDDAVRLTPNATLGETDQVDFPGEANAIAKLFNVDYFDPTQLPAMDERLGIPIRPPEAVQRLLERIQMGIEGMKQSLLNGDKQPPEDKQNEQKRSELRRPEKPATSSDKQQGKGN